MVMRLNILYTIAAGALLSACCCGNKYEMGTYGYDLKYLADKGFETVELKSADGQGRVMTSTTGGDEGASYGWINYKFIEAGEVSSQFNPYGGEERFWIGPEGGFATSEEEALLQSRAIPVTLGRCVLRVETAVFVRRAPFALR